MKAFSKHNQTSGMECQASTLQQSLNIWIGLDRLQLPVALFWSKKPDQTGLWNTTFQTIGRLPHDQELMNHFYWVWADTPMAQQLKTLSLHIPLPSDN